MIKVTMTQNDQIPLHQIDIHFERVLQEESTLPCVKQDLCAVMLYKIGEAVLRSGVVTGIIVGKNRNFHRFFL